MSPYTYTPSSLTEMLVPRQILYGNDCDLNGNNCNDYSSWDNWGRWVALVVIIVFFIILGFTLSFLANRHRRRIGRGPMPGTAWVPYVNGHGTTAPPAYGQHNYPQNNYPMAMPAAASGGMAPPKYAQQGPVDAQQTGTTFTGEPGYYGGHGASPIATSGVDVRQPAGAYTTSPRNDVEEYSPPVGPPPGRADEKV